MLKGVGPVANASSKKPKPIKGVYEHPVDSGIWWINYYVEGRRHREKVGPPLRCGHAVSEAENRCPHGSQVARDTVTTGGPL